MREPNLKQLAQMSGVSISLVSKTLNHQKGVSSEMRTLILQNAQTMGLQPATPSRPVDLYVILPETPRYFWDHAYVSLQKALEGKPISVQYNFVTHCMDDWLIRYYLEDARRLSARAVLLAGLPSRELQPALVETGKHCPLFFFYENHDLPGSYFFGSDAFADGVLIGNKCLADQNQNILIVGRNQDRINGIASVCKGRLSVVDFEAFAKAYAVAHFARKLEQLYRTSPFDAVVCIDGCPAQISLALQKLRLNIPVYGFENSPGNQQYVSSGRLVATVCQDIEKISQTAAQGVLDYLQSGKYPSAPCTYIQSNLLA